MTDYIDLTIETDSSALAQGAYDYLAANIDGWSPSTPNFESWLIEALAAMVAEARDVASAVPKSIFRYFGTTLLGLPPVEATYAAALTTWTFKDAAGYTVPAGTAFTLANADGVNLVFKLIDDLVKAPGGTTLGGAQARALDVGSIANDLDSTPRLLDILEFITDVTLDSPTTDGVDGESDDDYLDRLSRRLQLLTPRPILPRDFEVLAKDNVNVQRAVAINGYNPGDDTYDNPRTVAVVVHDAAGAALSGPIKTDIEDYLESLREVNFIVHVMDPTFSSIDVTFTAVAYAGWDIASVQAAAIANVDAFLSPATWGAPGAGLAGSLEWVNEPTVRYLELSQVINNTPGLNYITDLTLAITGDGLTADDVLMPGIAPLPNAGTVDGTVNAP